MSRFARLGLASPRASDRCTPPAPARVVLARIIGATGLACYNWWLGAALLGGVGISSNELFSDLEATGSPHAHLLRALDTAAGVLILAALVLRGRGPTGGPSSWWLLVIFAVAAIVGGLFPYQCPEGLSATCRAAEWHLRLDWRHYVHIAAGIAEFASASTAILLAWRRASQYPDACSWVIRITGIALWICYPLLAATYLTDRLGVLVEPAFFVSFSAIVAVELCKPRVV